MAPKKKAATSKARSKKIDPSSTPSKSTRATGRAVPETVTTKRGKEYETTAAASRPTRTTAQTALSLSNTAPSRTRSKPSNTQSTGAKRTAPTAPVGQPKKRGRPAKVSASPAKPKANATPTKRGRGRPAKAATAYTPVPATNAKRGPGRPRKAISAPSATATLAPKAAVTGKKRGRPANETVKDEPPRKRGRPSRMTALADAVPPEDEQPTPKKRGRPPYGGETTKIDGDDEAAAEQLEEELLDEADDESAPVEAPVKRGRGRPTGKGKQIAAAATIVDVAASPSGQQFWLMKAEQDGHEAQLANGETFNTKFTIDDLRAKDVPEPWDGVRNPTAAKNMRAMRTGDLAFFYASGGKMPGIVGIMEIVGEAEPDATASDVNSYGYVEAEAQRSKWCVVHVEFRKKLSRPITRTELIAGRDVGPLSQMQEFKAARLSVSKVSKDEWDYIGSLIEGFEDDEEDNELGNGNNVETDIAMEQEVDLNADLPNLPAAVPTAIMSLEQEAEQELPTADSIFPPVDVAETSVPIAAMSSTPTSRGSRAGSANRSLAPAPKAAGSSRNFATPNGRARSKTPQPPSGSVQPPPSPGGLMEAIGEE